jgi:cell division protein FtsL
MQVILDQNQSQDRKPFFSGNKFIIIFFTLILIISLGYVGYTFIDTLIPVGDSDEEVLAEEVDIKDVDEEIKKLERELQELE